mmetsp:Transcript_4568/g.7088  ORF Transcript_4568/g.7088 Transcript_4568/m.7088 type:complete len:102 (-) Transcript_4568:15-320(-)
MLVYEHSSADTIETIQYVLRAGLIKNPKQVCALFPLHDGLEELAAFQTILPSGSASADIGFVCASDIHDRAFEWVREQVLQGRPIREIQEALDEGEAWESL